jgi:hypothetical protein
MLYEPEFVYTGNKYKYWNGHCPDHKDTLLINMWRKINKELFDNSLNEPNFIVFSKFCFKEDRIKTHGLFQYSRTNKDCGIYISMEKYFMFGDEGILNTLKHEMVHQYLFQNDISDRSHNSINFIYHMGWFRVNLETKWFKVSKECKEYMEDRQLVIDLW